MTLVRLLGGSGAGRVIDLEPDRAVGVIDAGLAEPVQPGAVDRVADPPAVSPAAPIAAIGAGSAPEQFSVSPTPSFDRRWSVTDATGNVILNDAENKLSATELAWRYANMTPEERTAFRAERAAAAAAFERKMTEERMARPHIDGPVPVRLNPGDERVPPLRNAGDAPGPRPAEQQRRRRPGVFFS